MSDANSRFGYEVTAGELSPAGHNLTGIVDVRPPVSGIENVLRAVEQSGNGLPVLPGSVTSLGELTVGVDGSPDSVKVSRIIYTADIRSTGEESARSGYKIVCHRLGALIAPTGEANLGDAAKIFNGAE